MVSTKSEDERSKALASASTFSLKFAAVMAAISFLLMAWAWYNTA